jgi:hypothetical protein
MQWRLLDMMDDTGATDPLIEALRHFNPADPQREADRWMADWLRSKATDAALEGTMNVWLFTDDRDIAAYHTEQPGECLLHSDRLVTSLHMSYAARDRGCSGGGKLIVDHLVDLANGSGYDYLSLDPLDKATALIWGRHGFCESKTPAYEDEEADWFRLVRPVTGSSEFPLAGGTPFAGA